MTDPTTDPIIGTVRPGSVVTITDPRCVYVGHTFIVGESNGATGGIGGGGAIKIIGSPFPTTYTVTRYTRVKIVSDPS